MALAVTAEAGGDVTVLHLAGELDLATADQVDEAVRRQLDAGRPRLLAHLAGLDFCDSSGLAAFVRASRRCADAGGWLRLAGQHGRVARVLALTGLDEMLGDPADDGAAPRPTT